MQLSVEKMNTKLWWNYLRMYTVLVETKKTLDLWGFVTIKSCYYGWKHEFRHSGFGGRGGKSSTVTTSHVTASQNWVGNKPQTLLWHSEAKNQRKEWYRAFWHVMEWWSVEGHWPRQRRRSKWRPQQAYGSNQVLFAQQQTISQHPRNPHLHA